ncbi:MAG TPA: response regulator transcription factor [Ferrovibrio sp.]|uniref:response regulator transcription factor n=1 Tax=Ferrovibrio sp. TaxID=1917215 RepID=UPI002B4B8B7E|nr:response regulator transcription factor [Ferrovibrio sp.]HLT76586.1 response regulator transcription factor [Ferrovibrio sp.]
MADPVRILLVEDDPPTRRRLSTALAADPGFAVREAGTLAEGRAIMAETPPDVLITDLNLPDGHGTSLIREGHAAFPEMEILVISALSDERTVVAAIAAGASGYVLKDALPEDIADTVRQVRQGHSPISAAIARYILRRLPPQEEAAAPADQDAGQAARLTKRETDILWGIAKGFTYNEIADNLGVSRSTVPSYIKSIYRKLEVNSRGEAVFEAINRGLINF